MNTTPTKDKVACLLLGVFLAWVGLPTAIHATYVILIVVSFCLGHYWR